MLVSSLGTTKFGLPASLLNLFWGVLYWKEQAENELIRSGMLYTIVRPGGMERPTDTYKDTHNTVMYARDSMFTGQISRLQVRFSMSFLNALSQSLSCALKQQVHSSHMF